MRNSLSLMALIAALSALHIPCAIAGPASDSLSACVADNTTGKDRKDLARWIFASMATHPEMERHSSITAADREELDKSLATIVTKLLTENCKAETKLAYEKEGNAALETAFRVFGELAMQELMSNSTVKSTFEKYAVYLDQKKFEATFSSK